MKEGIIRDSYEASIKELQTVITVSHILAIGLDTKSRYDKARFNVFVIAFGYSFTLQTHQHYPWCVTLAAEDEGEGVLHT